jgi:virginiamycin B lyase
MDTPLRRPGMLVAAVAALLVLASSQSLAATTARHVRVKEYRVPTKRAGLIGIASGRDGNLWFAETFVHKVGRITTRGVVTEWNVPRHTTAWNMAAGPDGNVWFTTDDK